MFIAFQLQYYFVCVSGPVFVCVYAGLSSRRVHVCVWRSSSPNNCESRGPAYCSRGSSLLSNSLTLLPSNLFLSFHVSEPLYLFPDLCEMYTEAHVSVGCCCRRRAGPAGQTIEEIPQAHMELVSFQFSERRGGTRTWVGKKRK